MTDCQVFDCRVLPVMGQTDKVEDWSLIHPSDSFSALGLVVWYRNIPCIISVLILYTVAFLNSFLSLIFETENS